MPSENEPLIFHEVACGDLQAVEESLANNQNLLQYRNYQGASLYFIAARYGHIHIIRYLESIGCSYEQAGRDFHGRSPLFWAASRGQIEVIRYLVEVASDRLDERTINGSTLLMHATKSRSLSAIQELIHLESNLRGHVSIPFQINLQGMNAIAYAARAGREQIVQWLFEHYDTFLSSYTNLKGETIIMLAAQSGNVALVQWLLQKVGSDLLAVKNTTNNSALSYAVFSGSIPTLKLLLSHSEAGSLQNEKNIVHLASRQKNHTMLRFLVEQLGSSVLGTTNHGLLETPFMLAAQMGHLEHLQYFTEITDLSWLLKENVNQATLYSYALKNGHIPVLQWLQEKLPASFQEEKDRLNFPILLNAAYQGNENLVTWLITVNPQLIRHKNAAGQTVIMYAARAGQLAIVEKLVELGGVKLIQDSDRRGVTALLATVSCKMQFDQENFVAKSVNFYTKEPQLSVLRWFIKHGTPGLILRRDNDRWDACAHALYSMNIELLITLIDSQQFNFTGVDENGRHIIESMLSSLNLNEPKAQQVIFLLYREALRQGVQLNALNLGVIKYLLNSFYKIRTQKIANFLEYSTLLMEQVGQSITTIIQSYSENPEDDDKLYLFRRDKELIHSKLRLEKECALYFKKYTEAFERSDTTSILSLWRLYSDANQELHQINQELTPHAWSLKRKLTFFDSADSIIDESNPDAGFYL